MLEQLLTLLRAGASPEARQNALSTIASNQRSDTFAAAMTRITELRGMANRTADQTGEMSLLMEGAKFLRSLIEEDNSSEADFQALSEFHNQPGSNNRGLFGNGQRRSDAPEDDTTPGRRGGRQVGTDLVEIGGRAVDHEGFGMPEKAFRASMEPSYIRAYWRGLLGRADSADRQTLANVTNLCRSFDTGLVDPDGGFVTPPQLFAEIIGPDSYPSGLLDVVTTRPCESGSFWMFKNTYTGSDIYNSPFRKTRTSGLTGPTEQTNPPLGLIEVPIHESFIKIKVPRAMLEDNIIGLQAYIQEQMRDAYRLGTSAELAFGSGVGEPEGILTNAGATGGASTYNVGATPDPARWVKFYREVPPMYREGAVLVTSDAAYQDVEGSQDANGAFPFAVVNLTDSAATGSPTERFRGKPIVYDPFYPDYGSANKVASFGNHKRAYYYGLRLAATMGVRNIADESFVTFVMRIRDGGKLVLPQALRIAVASAP